MHSIRRAALRAACSSTVAAVPRQQVASLAMHMSRANSMRAAAALPLSRQFSQSFRMAQQDTTSAEPTSAGVAASEDVAPPASSEPAAQSERQEHTIFISNMTFDATDVHLEEAFGHYGEILSVSIMRDQRGLSRGFGFVNFKERAAAEEAVKQADKSFWHGRRINVDHRKPSTTPKGPRQPTRAPSSPSTSLYIGNIPYETSDADLNDIFRELDGVADVRVAVDRNTGWPRGFAHADFSDLDSAIAAYEKLRGTKIGGRLLRVDYSEARRSKPTNSSPESL